MGSGKDMVEIFLANERAYERIRAEERKANQKFKPPASPKKMSYKEFKRAAKNEYVDVDAEKLGAHKMYQYTDGQKRKLCMDDEDFIGYITQKHKSLKKRPDLRKVFDRYRPRYKREMEEILYPATT